MTEGIPLGEVPAAVEPAFGLPRAHGWARLAHAHLTAHPECYFCDRVRPDNVPHHRVPVHVDPAKELDPANLRTACPACHLTICHEGDWQEWNEEVDEVARLMRSGRRPRPLPAPSGPGATGGAARTSDTPREYAGE